MCGISFYWSSSQQFNNELQKSLQATSHRGPDASSWLYRTESFGHIALGHNRLSIIDLSELGNQPMSKSHVTVVFNGEIYNYKKLRAELEAKKYVFKSNSDTEVLLAMYTEYGVDCFAKLNGMFSFVLFDERSELVYLARDTVGIKPLYLYQEDGGVFACSEIKGLKQFSHIPLDICGNDIFEFFNNGFLYEPSTGFKHIKKLMPGHYLKIDLKKRKHETVKFADVRNFNSDSNLEVLISNALQQQEVADVPLGIFFSGGADSSILASLSGGSELLFAKYSKDPSSDVDLKYSGLIANFLDRKLHVTDIESENSTVEAILDSFDFVGRHTEELISDYTFWSTYRLSVAARSQGFKVMLSGMGGDEAFAGYPRYQILKNDKTIRFALPLFLLMKRARIFPSSISKKLDRLISYIREPVWSVGYSRLLGYFSTNELNALFSDYDNLMQKYRSRLDKIELEYEGDKRDKVKLAQHFDLKGFLAHNLIVSDKASMLASIELRVPLLDEHIVAKGLSTNSDKLIAGKILKYPLRNLLTKLIPAYLAERPKTGFNPPLDGLISMLGRDVINQQLRALSSLFDMRSIEVVVDDHFSGKVNNTYKVWQLLYFARWLKWNKV